MPRITWVEDKLVRYGRYVNHQKDGGVGWKSTSIGHRIARYALRLVYRDEQGYMKVPKQRFQYVDDSYQESPYEWEVLEGVLSKLSRQHYDVVYKKYVKIKPHYRDADRARELGITRDQFNYYLLTAHKTIEQLYDEFDQQDRVLTGEP